MTEEPKEKIMSVRLPWWLYKRLEAEAKENERTASQQLRYILIQHFEAQNKQTTGEDEP